MTRMTETVNGGRLVCGRCRNPEDEPGFDELT